MSSLRHLCTWLACALGALAAPVALADDIDIFVGTSGGTAAAPNVMFLLDNTSNWSRNNEHWPDAPTQGDAELQAIAQVLPGIAKPANIGLAELTDTGSPIGGYGGFIRFAARDITNPANVTALQNILLGINVNAPTEKIAIAHKDDAAALYELYKYFYGLSPYAGSSTGNPEADFAGNVQRLTGAGQGLTSGFAFDPATGRYVSPMQTCAKNYVIYIVNNANNTGIAGFQTYETTSAGAALPPTPIDFWDDEWGRFLFKKQITTYVIDVYNPTDKNGDNAAYSLSLMSLAKQGGGKYYTASSKAQILSAIYQILDEIQAVSSSFAAANLPASANQRTYDVNQVFIGMFQPDPSSLPRWFGNMKEYQLAATAAGAVSLVDVNGLQVVNPLTGFVTSCAQSFWTVDTSAYPLSGVTPAQPYWSIVPVTPQPLGTCPGASGYSDLPDGPIVEKGAAAEVLRMGNNPGSAATWSPATRNILTLSSTSPTGPSSTPTTPVAFTAASSGLSQSLVNFTRGYDVNDENGNGLTDGTNGLAAESRPSIHGDVVHSQPVAVNYGSGQGVVVYYGANDGMLHAINGANGQELWSFVAPEFFPRLNRLMTNSPTINYWGTPSGITPTPTSKDYFFDGSFGLYQDATNAHVWIFPGMRRGGRMLYGLDVTTANSPKVLWRVGCPDLTDNTGCSTNMTNIGQTWSTPRVAFLSGYSTTKPVVIVGGGYDPCEDTNWPNPPAATPACTPTTGNAVYVLDAATGTQLAKLATDNAVAADITLLDMNFDGYVDYAYAADTGGHLYRISFVNGSSTLTGVAAAQWTITKVAYTADPSGNRLRKFLYAPAVFPNNGQVYLAIGSGDREHPLQGQYPYTYAGITGISGVQNRFYLFLDDPTSSTLYNLDDASSTGHMADCTLASNCTGVSVVPGGSLKGWFMTLNRHGTDEQVVSGAAIAAGMVSFGTNRPIPSSTGTCATILGEARGYWVNLLNSQGMISPGATGVGSRSSTFPAGGFPNTPQVSTVMVGGQIYTVVGGAASLTGGANSTLAFQRVTPPIASKRKRVYWYTPADP